MKTRAHRAIMVTLTKGRLRVLRSLSEMGNMQHSILKAGTAPDARQPSASKVWTFWSRK